MIKPRNTGAFGIPTGIHYAWIVMLIAAVMHMVGGSIRQAFGVLIVPLEEANAWNPARSEEHTSELQSLVNLVCRLLLEKKKKNDTTTQYINKTTLSNIM